MNTLILRPFSKEIEGIAEYINIGDKIKIKYSIKRSDINDTRIYKLMLMSSIRPSAFPIVADTAEFKGMSAYGKRLIDGGTLAINGYCGDDIDTFAFVRRDENKITVACVGFARLSWDIYESLRHLTGGYEDSALARADKALDSMRKPADADTYQKIMAELISVEKVLPKCELNPYSGYRWYELRECRMPLSVSSYEHILTDKVFDIVKNGARLMFGIGEDGATAFACDKSDTNPFENAADCSIRIGGFWVVGVRLSEDGQYFERLKF